MACPTDRASTARNSAAGTGFGQQRSRPDAAAPGGLRLGSGWGSRPASHQLATAILMDHTGDEDRVDAQTHELFIDDVLHAFPHRGPWRLRATAIDAWLADFAPKAAYRRLTGGAAGGLRRPARAHPPTSHVSTLPVPLGDRRSRVRGDPTARSFPEMPVERPETASGPVAEAAAATGGLG